MAIGHALLSCAGLTTSLLLSVPCQERELKTFRDTLKQEVRLLKQETDMLPRDRRKEAFKTRRDRLDSDHQSKERDFIERLNESHESSLQRLAEQHREKIALMEKQFLQQKQQVRQPQRTQTVGRRFRLSSTLLLIGDSVMYCIVCRPLLLFSHQLSLFVDATVVMLRRCGLWSAAACQGVCGLGAGGAADPRETPDEQTPGQGGVLPAATSGQSLSRLRPGRQGMGGGGGGGLTLRPVCRTFYPCVGLGKVD